MKPSFYISWIVYAAFVAIATVSNGGEDPFVSKGPYPVGKYLAWIAFLLFTAYSFHCSRNENLFKTIKVMKGLHWGRQIGIDLYIGAFLFTILIYANEQSALLALFWFIPIVAFVNLATLLYVALNYDSLVQLLIS